MVHHGGQQGLLGNSVVIIKELKKVSNYTMVTTGIDGITEGTKGSISYI